MEKYLNLPSSFNFSQYKKSKIAKKQNLMLLNTLFAQDHLKINIKP
jgi:hypothetical protein